MIDPTNVYLGISVTSVKEKGRPYIIQLVQNHPNEVLASFNILFQLDSTSYFAKIFHYHLNGGIVTQPYRGSRGTLLMSYVPFWHCQGESDSPAAAVAGTLQVFYIPFLIDLC